jgi:hypothetical protein
LNSPLSITSSTLALLALLLCSCGTYQRRGAPPHAAQLFTAQLSNPKTALTPELQQQILRLNPNQVSSSDIQNILSHTPAPRILLIHGGVWLVIPRMISFADFLTSMGYPAASLTNAHDGTYTISCYESSDMIAGTIAFYYEKEGLRPILIGHSQGAMQIVKVLHKLEAPHSHSIPVWNPYSWSAEPRTEIIDPLTQQPQPVVGLTIPYATGMGGGGVTRLMPNQWDMLGRLRSIPNSVEEYTYFYKHFDLLGGDWLGYGPANLSKPKGTAAVRNVRLPTGYHHGSVPDTRHLAQNPEIVEWINHYNPLSPPDSVPDFSSDSRNILWAADVWFSIKKHWVLELQRWIQHQHPSENAP